jgi:hypothetical protein
VAGSNGKLSLRDQILQCDDIQVESVTVPELGGVTLEVRGMDGDSRANWMRDYRDPDSGEINYQNLYPVMVIETCFDPSSGEPVFTAADAAGLGKKSGAALERVARVSMRLSGLTESAEDELGKDSSKASDASTSN